MLLEVRVIIPRQPAPTFHLSVSLHRPPGSANQEVAKGGVRV